jgi:hypothetical protein
LAQAVAEGLSKIGINTVEYAAYFDTLKITGANAKAM